MHAAQVLLGVLLPHWLATICFMVSMILGLVTQYVQNLESQMPTTKWISLKLILYSKEPCYSTDNEKCWADMKKI